MSVSSCKRDGLTLTLILKLNSYLGRVPSLESWDLLVSSSSLIIITSIELDAGFIGRIGLETVAEVLEVVLRALRVRLDAADRALVGCGPDVAVNGRRASRMASSS